jgi:hypothetical protein
MPHFWITSAISYPPKVCDMLRFGCATCSGFTVRHGPVSLCDMLRFMQVINFHPHFIYYTYYGE